MPGNEKNQPAGMIEKQIHPVNDEQPSSKINIDHSSEVKPKDTCQRTPKILIVEDSPVTQIFLRKILSTLGHNVAMATDGIEALELIKQQHFDLVFMDLEMPILDGLETMQKINEMFEHIPSVIAITATSSLERINLCYRMGMIDYVVKPFSTQAIQGVVEQWLS